MGRAKSWKGVQIYTVGHSTRSFDELVALLRAFEVTRLVDIRTIPRSLRNPQFNEDTLRSGLRARKISYLHLPELGGLRRARKDSVNTGFRNASFRGFADYMQTDEFELGLSRLRDAATGACVALMCAEAVPWRCHRSLVGDALLARGAKVEDITSATRASPHRMTRFAKVEGTRVTYPGDAEGGLETRAPFHLEATVRVLQRRPINPVECFEEDKYLRVIATDEARALVEVSNYGTIDRPKLGFRVCSGKNPIVRERLRKVLGLDVKPAPLLRALEEVRGLGALGVALRGMRPPRFAELFEAFANVVPFQQVSLDAGIAIVRRLTERFGRTLEHDGRTYFAFPTAADVAGARIDALRKTGMSARKAETLRRIARAIVSGELTEERLTQLPSKDAIELLRELPGIGPWSASLVLLRGLGRLDVFPPGDVGVARGLGKLLRVPKGRSLAPVIERFGDLRGYLYFCSLGAALLERGLIHAAPDPRVR